MPQCPRHRAPRVTEAGERRPARSADWSDGADDRHRGGGQAGGTSVQASTAQLASFGPVAVLVPVKAFGEAKLRLAPALDPTHRATLARTMATHVVTSAAPLPTAVVCDDAEVAAWRATSAPSSCGSRNGASTGRWRPAWPGWRPAAPGGSSWLTPTSPGPGTSNGSPALPASPSSPTSTTTAPT